MGLARQMSQQKQHSQRSKRPAVVKSEPKQVAEQDKPQVSRPTTDDEEAWGDYWKTQNQPWRTEPEISLERQEELEKRRAIVPDIKGGIYPFGGMKLSRADVEWLLTTHDGGRGPVDWNNEQDRAREGLDLRCADLCDVNLQGLPLARMVGGLNGIDWDNIGLYKAGLAGVHLERTVLDFAHLEGAILNRAHLEHASFSNAHLEEAAVNRAFLGRAYLKEVHLEKASLRHAHLERSYLGKAQLGGADLTGAHLEGTNLFEACFVSKKLNSASSEILPFTNLRSAFFDDATTLQGANFGEKEHGCVLLADVRWGGVNLSALNWSQMKSLGDEEKALQKIHNGGTKQKDTRLSAYSFATRANRQLAVALRNQGLNEVADHFAYRAQLCQRAVLWYQGWPSWVKWLGSWFLTLIAGYGYKPWRTILWYLFIIGSFASAYSFIGHLPPWPDSLVFSVMSFHGRGFFPSLSGETSLHNPVVICAAAEAVVGLLIEVSFIATFTQRFFGK